jgi:TonB-linked SusC/RagA family outer membrane protein
MIRFYVFLMILGLSFSSSYGQRIITGKVTAAEDGSGIPGVNILVQGTTRGTMTDIEGKFTISLQDGDKILVFSFIGYKTQSIAVTTQSVIDVSLESESMKLNELVVVGYGTQRKSDLTGSVSSVKGSELTKIPSLNPVQSLQGKVPGVQVSSESGAPGAKTIVRIRGIGTFNNAAPIYVVDGVILDNIDFLNASDIQSLEVLKDASATAIYGSRGANGVIIVTTKQGTENQEFPTVNFSAEYSVQQLSKKIDLLNGPQFATIANEINPGSYNNIDLVPNTDWQGLIFQSAPIQNYQASVSGASAKVQYYIGLGYFNQQGIIPKSNYERLTIKLNNTYHLTKNITLGNNLTLAPYSQQNTIGNAVFVVYRAQPVITPYKPDGSYSEVPGVGNVLADIENTNSYNSGYRMVGNFYGEVKFLKDFTFKSSLGLDYGNNKAEAFTPVFYVSPQQQNSISRLSKNYSNTLTWLWENTLNYNKEFGKNRINVLGGYTMQEATSEYLNLEAQNLTRDSKDFWYINQNNINPNAADNGVYLDQNYSMISYLFRVNYTFNNRYLLTATYRRDGSSKFAKDNRYADFPSFALGWNVINESFMKNVRYLSNLKLRASWGIIGNEKIPYDRQYSGVDNGINAVFGKNEKMVPGMAYGLTGNPDLKWESTYQTDIGIETGFFNDKLTGEFDFYNRDTKDILIDLPVSGYLGNGEGARITYNAGEVLNRGFEMNLNWSGNIHDFNYRIGANGTTIHNEALKVRGTGGNDDALEGLFNGVATRTVPGIPIGSFYGYQTNGIFQNADELAAYPHRSDALPGYLRYVDTNHDGIIDGNDRTNLGSPIPKYMFGISLGGAWKGFDLSIDIQGQGGNKIFNGKETIRPDLYNFEKHVINRWTGPGTSNIEPVATAGGYNWLNSSRFILDGSFVRLRNVTFSYTLPEVISKKMLMKNARVYVRGTNLFTYTKFSGYTPEVASENPILNGIDAGTYPIPAIYSAGVNVTF